MINLFPEKCNLCNGKVVYTKNSIIYGKEFGSGYCYYCQDCGAYVGTHTPRPKEALGILANEEMRKLKIKAHTLFDKLNGTKNQKYKWLSKQMNIPKNECHFGYMDKNQLLNAIKIMEGVLL